MLMTHLEPRSAPAQGRLNRLVVRLNFFDFLVYFSFNVLDPSSQREKAIASCLFSFVYFRSSTSRRFLLQFGTIVINSGTNEIF